MHHKSSRPTSLIAMGRWDIAGSVELVPKAPLLSQSLLSALPVRGVLEAAVMFVGNRYTSCVSDALKSEKDKVNSL